ncbi:copper resistance D family protein [Sinosporangium siamense]|uniref:Copper resistance protein CopD n=1 Tax=Sinosporangium siamense TaxID=1367973 RepID=A0A919RGC7_9ACTN|nr:CopD family protein [Sinosporangium siamense]GII91889.1 copper resistance protein CopD [Sinosporangium siamense]
MTLTADPPAEASPDVRRLATARRLIVFGLISSTVVAVLIGSAFTGEEPAPGIPMPGPFVVYGLPVVRAMIDLAAVAVVGLTVLPKLLGFGDPSRTEPVMSRVRPLAVSLAWVWALCALVTIVFQAAELNPGQVPSIGTVVDYVSSVGAGQGLLFSTACALASAGIGLLAVRFGESVPAELRIVIALFGLLPIPVTGHAVDSVWHDPIMISMELHVLGAALWTGGLLAVMLFVTADRELLATTLPKFSRLATLCLVVVSLSGLISGLSTMALTPGVELPGAIVTTGYGWLLVAKVVFTLMLLPIAAHIRYRLLPRVERREGTAVAMWAVAELVIMGAAYGVAVALTRAPVG